MAANDQPAPRQPPNGAFEAALRNHIGGMTLDFLRLQYELAAAQARIKELESAVVRS